MLPDATANCERKSALSIAFAWRVQRPSPLLTQFTIRELLLVTVLVGAVIGWVTDSRALQRWRQRDFRYSHEALLNRGFRTISGVYELSPVELKQAAKVVGFELTQMRATDGDVPYSDIRTVSAGGVWFTIESLEKDREGNVVSGSLDNYYSMVAISTSLRTSVPQP